MSFLWPQEYSTAFKAHLHKMGARSARLKFFFLFKIAAIFSLHSSFVTLYSSLSCEENFLGASIFDMFDLILVDACKLFEPCTVLAFRFVDAS